MEQKLLPIYTLRIMFLEKLNPIFFSKNAELIYRTSMAAQDYFLSGAYKEYNNNMGHLFKTLPGYIAIHNKYNLPYDPYSVKYAAILNPGLVMDLTWSLKTDITNTVVNKNGSINATDKLPQYQPSGNQPHGGSFPVSGNPVSPVHRLFLSSGPCFRRALRPDLQQYGDPAGPSVQGRRAAFSIPGYGRSVHLHFLSGGLYPADSSEHSEPVPGRADIRSGDGA